jgi:Ala-tRNA(Pro) deacylase
MPIDRLKEYLNKQRVKYVTLSHSAAFTAQEVAASAHIKGLELAKTVIVTLDGKLMMCVLPASHQVDFALLRESTNSSRASLVPEQDYKEKFPDCAPGSQPPFGNLYGMDVLVSSALLQDREIAFNACSYSELIRLSLDDYLKLVNPKVLDFSVQRERRKAA